MRCTTAQWTPIDMIEVTTKRGRVNYNHQVASIQDQTVTVITKGNR